MTKEFKFDLELHSPGDGRMFLNFWNYHNGDDVTAEIKDGKIYKSDDSEKEDFEYDKEISFQDFIDQVKEKIHVILEDQEKSK